MKRVSTVGCEGKIRLNTFAQAEKVAAKSAHRHHEQFHAYRCDRCGGYHVGESSERKNRTYRRRQVLDSIRVREEMGA